MFGSVAARQALGEINQRLMLHLGELGVGDDEANGFLGLGD